MNKLNLLGPVPFPGFKSDGASGVPDRFIMSGLDIYPAAEYHDYAYYLIRKQVVILRDLKKQIKNQRKLADRNFRKNMALCAGGKFPKRAIVFFIKRIYFHGVRILGRWAIRGENHEGN